MFKFHHLKTIKVFLGIGLLITATICAAITTPHFEKYKFQPTTSKIIFKANKIQPSSDGKENMLNGNVQLIIGDSIKISADNVLVKYADGGKNAVAEFIIYGKGTLTDGKHLMQFVNGTFNPNTSQLTAQKIS